MKLSSLGIVMATRMEAAPFIQGLGLEALAERPCSWYGSGRMVLVVTGIGKTAAAMATTLLIERHGAAPVLNLGAAGATSRDLPVGTILPVNRIIETDRPDLRRGGPSIIEPSLLPGFTGVTLATQDRVVIDTADRSRIAGNAALVDMEGAAVARVCRSFNVDCHCFKIVTDTPGQGLEDIIRNIGETSLLLFDFFQERIRPALLPLP